MCQPLQKNQEVTYQQKVQTQFINPLYSLWMKSMGQDNSMERLNMLNKVYKENPEKEFNKTNSSAFE